MCVCMIIKLNITGQPGPVILIFQCYTMDPIHHTMGDYVFAYGRVRMVITFSNQILLLVVDDGNRIFPVPVRA